VGVCGCVCVNVVDMCARGRYREVERQYVGVCVLPLHPDYRAANNKENVCV